MEYVNSLFVRSITRKQSRNTKHSPLDCFTPSTMREEEYSNNTPCEKYSDEAIQRGEYLGPHR